MEKNTKDINTDTKNMCNTKGITLIALVITIIILLILAGISISALTGSGLFEKAKLAKNRTKEAEELENQRLSEYETQINELGGQKQEDIPGISAKDILDSEDKSKYYGKIVKGYSCKASSDLTWRLLYASDDNLYLMTDENIDFDIIPKGRNGSSVLLQPYTTNNVLLKNILKDYSGSSDISLNYIQKLNDGCFDSQSSSLLDGWKAVAYLLDVDVWDEFKNEELADYSIGGPTLSQIDEALRYLLNVNNNVVRNSFTPSVDRILSEDGKDHI